MANLLQKLIYYFSAMCPIGVIFSVVWLIQKDNYWVPIMVTLGVVLLMVLFGISFNYGCKHLSPINVRVTDVSANDTWILGYIISYLLPLTSLIIDEWNLLVCVIIGVFICLLIPFMNSAIPHPLLALKKYHFYQISTENGISSYVLISKKNIRNKKEIQVVGRIFEFLLIEK